ncbi:abnormal spindle-like microcephaly-associated protein isoform X4 [Vulpes lagopus]|uniref:abnormal spindle-like microcephaly-associated protein isoform X4 n=1 Tax=Vulpes lagopus TaxID=494514 RepID=UPI001BC9A4ED|nr:abnormal spindle-like microcephaly-associated protein isoform X4 [Vulpes lagopus]
MATRRAGRSWEVSPSGPRPAAGEAAAASPPVLSLSHFCRSPFLCFGDVRLGGSRTLPLLLHNPNAEAARVEVCGAPAAQQGFSVSPRRFQLQPEEKIVISVNWTPLKEGRVRETVTFLVNDVLKHQAILLGNAEEQKKKKRSLWGTIKKKKMSASSNNKRISSVQNVNKTFCVSQKADRVRNPLQACENLDMNEGCSPTENNSLILEENKIPISPISPIFKECHGETSLPLSVRRSTTYISLHARENGDLLKVEDASILEDFSFSEKVVNEASFNSTNNTNDQTEENCKLILTPPSSSTLNITQSQGNFLSPDSFVSNSCAANNELEVVTCLSSNILMKDNSMPLHLESKSVHENYRKILSPDSFINDNYGLNQNLESEPINPILSPNQFVKDNMAYTCIYQQTCKLSLSSNKNSQFSQSQDPRTNGILPCIPECQSSKSPKATFEEHRALEMKSDCYSFTKNRPKFSAMQDISSCSQDKLTRRPILSATITKRKSNCTRENQKETNKPKAKRCLNSVADSRIYRTPNSKTSKKTKSIVAVAQSTLTFIKPLKTDIPRHPMPFAAKNMFYDERWKEKQEQGFTWWLNFILTPDDFTVKTNISEVNAATLLLGVESQHKISVPRAPTKDEMSLRAYTARCRLNRLRRAACRLFTSEKMVKAIKKLEIEIEARRLIVRRDRHLWKDVGERQKVLNWLLSYNPLWLRIGLETVFGELLSLEDNSDVTGLAVFILNRLLWNPDIAAEYRHPTVPHLYRDGHEEALSKFTLKKLLLLVCFLDYAKISKLIDHDPCLFCKDAEFKTSKDILLAFSRDFLSGEGDLSRHLSLLGLPVNHVQTPFDEFDFAVTNLAVDLQCGVRLVRIMELLTRDWNLSKKLRMPAISRLQKMHNVDIVLQILRSQGIQLNDEHGNAILSKDIVDRHREKTLALLWKIAFAFQVDISLNLDQLKEEIDFLKHTQSMKKMSAQSCHSDVITNKKKDNRNSGSFEQYSESIKLLMEWVNAVCAFYNKKVENFTVSFSDGRVLCYLIHHYHPYYVPFDAICQRTTQTVECTQTGSVVLNSSSESDGSSLDLSLKAFDHVENTSELYKELLENEKKNFQLVRSAVRDLGGIPAMINHSDMSNTIPDEKVVITYLSFLCSRLLDLCKETRAARLIQTTWRKYKLKTDLKRHQEQDKAARIIQSAIINFLTKRRLKKEISAALAIQKYWRRFLAQRKLLMLKKEKLEKVQNESASVIQRYWRRYSTRKQFLKLKYYSIILQSRIRMIIAVTSYKRYLWATVTIQRHWRASLRSKHDQQRYKMLKSSCLIIQSMFRRWKRRKMQLQIKATIVLQRAFREWHVRKRAKEEKSAIVIQSWYRMHKELRKYVQIRSCVVIIQTRFRCLQAQKLYKRKKEAILTIQKYYKAYLKGKMERTNYLQKRAAAILLQTAFRRMKARNLYRQSRAACVLQSYWRMRQDRFRFLNLKKITTKLQAQVRKHQQLQKYRKIKKAALVIQIHFRAYVSAKKVLASYQKTRSAVLVLQSAYRGMQARKKFIHILTSIIKIQSCYRAYISRKRFLRLKNATVKLQSIVKMRQTRKRYLHWRAAALIIQRWYRWAKLAALKRHEYVQMRESCIKLQAFVRGHLVRKQIRLQRQAAISLQSYFRMRKKRQYYLEIYKATLVIQNYYRAYKAQVNQRKNFLQVKRAVTCLQAAYRGYKVRQLIKQQSIAALKIQTAFRGYRERKKYQYVLQSTVKIQRWYRTCRTVRGIRTQFLKTKAAVISLQCAYRGWKVRKQIGRERQAAVRIQSAFRMAKAQKQFKLLKTAALVIQQHLRAWTAGKRQRMEYIELREAALRLQSTWKGKRVRRQIQKQHKCAVIIQSNYRMYVQQKKWKMMKKAARLIQMYYRAYSIGRKQRQLYLKTKAAAVVLQSAYRSMKVRKKIKECNRAAVTIQSTYRAYKTKKNYANCRASAIVIQRWYRGIKIANHQRKEYLNLKKTAVKIQAIYRGIRVRRHNQHLHMAATVIQAMFKMHQAKMRYHKMRTAAVIIQAVWRSYKARKYLHQVKAACKIQAWYRYWKARKDYLAVLKAVKIIQGCFYTKLERTRFLNVRASTIIIQRKWRAILSGRIAREHFLMMKRHQAACLIQANFRRYKARQVFLRQKSAALTIQRYIRARKAGKCQRIKYVELKKSTVVLQALVRGWLVRKRILEQRTKIRLLHFTAAAYYHLSALKIQRAYKHHMSMKNANKQVNAVICIQRWFRTRLQQKRFAQKYPSILTSQHEVPECMSQQNRAASVIQKAVRRFLLRKKQEKFNNAISRIQALWRGYSWRKKNDCTKIKAIRLSLQLVNREIREENKLYKRTALALHYLLTYKHLSAILEALKHLEVVTRLSPLCCENMAQSGAVSKIFVLIRSCNRSIPCMEVIRYAVQVLLNVAKYEKTTAAVSDAENCIDTLLDLLQMYREKPGDKVADKGGSIFTKTCCLLAVLLKTTNRASSVRSKSKVVDRIYSLYKLTARKHKMNTERTLYKQKMNSSISTPFIPETPVRTRIVSRLKPDWVLRRDNMEEITNPLQAIQMVMDTLGIPY